MGKPLCLFLTCLRKMKRKHEEVDGKNRNIRRLLFIKFIEQGATVLAYNALHEAIEKYGRDNVYFAVFEENRDILDILQILPEKNILSLRSKSPFTFLGDWLKTLKRIRRLNIDATIDFEFFTRAPAVFSYLTGAPVRVGLHRFNSELPYRGDLMTHRVQYNPYLHVSVLYTIMLRALEADVQEEPLLKTAAPMHLKSTPLFKPSKEEIKSVTDKISGLEKLGGPIILLNPNASDMLPLRKWPAERFIALGKKILKEFKEAGIVITGAPSEQAAAEEIGRAIGKRRVVSLAGKTTLRELVVLYTRADVLITNDSGPSHFSSLTDIHTIVLFGPETPELYGGRGSNTHILWAGLACSPCVNVFNHRFSPCTNNRCMQAISVNEVFGKIKEIL
jgi:ADP-heptose:LPS heptosyltransferase